MISRFVFQNKIDVGILSYATWVWLSRDLRSMASTCGSNDDDNFMKGHKEAIHVNWKWEDQWISGKLLCSSM